MPKRRSPTASAATLVHVPVTGVYPGTVRAMVNARKPMRHAAAAAVVLGLLSRGARADAPMGYLETFGPRGHEIAALTWGLIVQSVVVVAIISALVVAGVFRRRLRRGVVPGEPLPVERSGGRTGLRWMYIGLALTTVALLASVVWTMSTLAAIHEPPAEPTVTIEVTGHQWWWEVRYTSRDASRVFETANEIHIPVGVPVRFKLRSADVIHSFWVPKLGGKTDLIPGQTNETWLQADQAGVYRGQCVEYCGKQHAHMILRLFADPPEVFQAWWDGQVRSAPEPRTPLLTAGRRQFVLRCGACHTVRGTPAGGAMGPDLTHLMSRTTIAAGMLPNTVGYLSGWIANPRVVKPGTRMPNIDLPPPELTAIRSYLLTLN
ncbi:cytochrome c oxidase subunit II [Azospirillum sp. ST 5-10]|uniref:cytochrome c oxidase subunit II n=1 Tax=unclassified Azospirillum TaxID=2630922 RepID=UPI003F49F9A5